jgi:hypothetical protein
MATFNDIPEDVYHLVISEYLDYNSRVNFNLALPRLWRIGKKFTSDPNWHDRRITINRFADYIEKLLENPFDLIKFIQFYKFLLTDAACKLVGGQPDLHEVVLRKSDQFIRDINTRTLPYYNTELKQELITYCEAVKANFRSIKPAILPEKTKLIEII